MHVIYKFAINDPRNVIMADVGARFIHVGMDPNDQLCVWAIVNPDAPTKNHTLVVFGTGERRLDQECHIYIGTWFNGPFVWHLFSEEEKEVKKGKRGKLAIGVS